MKRGAVVVLLPLVLLAGCGGSSGSTSSSSATSTSAAATSGPAITGTITVFAASSLTDVFTALGTQFEAAHKGVTVTFNFGSSATLATQITQGAPADLFAAASPTTMQTVTDAGDTAQTPATFVTNTLEIAVPADNPGKVTGLKDFANPDLTIALCDPTAPCGAAATKVFAAAGITPMPDSLETDVKATITKVELGEVDAALVYRTDVLSGGDKVKGIDFPEASQAINDYLISTLKAAPNADGAAAFEAFIQSDTGVTALKKAGFGTP